MATQQQTDAFRAQVQTALGTFTEQEIALVLRSEVEQKAIAAEAQRLSTVPLPALTTEQWAELKAYLIDDTGDPFDPGRALIYAYQGAKEDNQPKFWRGLLASARAILRAHPEVRIEIRLGRSCRQCRPTFLEPS